MGFELYFAKFDIRSIDTYHETSAELSRSSGDDDVASRLLLPVRTPLPGITLSGGCETVEIGPVHGCQVMHWGF